MKMTPKPDDRKNKKRAKKIIEMKHTFTATVKEVIGIVWSAGEVH